MNIKTNCIIGLYNILKQDNLDKGTFDTFFKSRGMARFLEYESKGNMGLGGNCIKDELKKVVMNRKHVDRYGFHEIKGNLSRLKEDIEYIEGHQKIIIKEVLRGVYKIVPRHMVVKARIFLYAGGVEEGFIINRKEIYINYGRYIGRLDDFLGILSHGLYHCRRISLENRIKYLFRIAPKQKRYMYMVVGKFMEEGIACLVQYGPTLQKETQMKGLTRRSLLLCKKEFNLLNDILLKIKDNSMDYLKVSQLNNYIIGYHIVSTVYRSEGVLILDYWTESLRYKEIIKRYIDICNRRDLATGFIEEAEKFLEYT